MADPISILAIAGAQTGMAAINGIAQSGAQKKALRSQESAQQQALSAAKRQEALNAQEFAKLNKKQPDVAAILARSQLDAGKLPSTMLTGPRGVTGGLLGQ